MGLKDENIQGVFQQKHIYPTQTFSGYIIDPKERERKAELLLRKEKGESWLMNLSIYIMR